MWLQLQCSPPHSGSDGQDLGWQQRLKHRAIQMACPPSPLPHAATTQPHLPIQVSAL